MHADIHDVLPNLPCDFLATDDHDYALLCSSSSDVCVISGLCSPPCLHCCLLCVLLWLINAEIHITPATNAAKPTTAKTVKNNTRMRCTSN